MLKPKEKSESYEATVNKLRDAILDVAKTDRAILALVSMSELFAYGPIKTTVDAIKPSIAQGIRAMNAARSMSRKN